VNIRQLWVGVYAVAVIPSNLCRGYSLREQYATAKIAVRVEGM
jgi:hypothetical protein